MQSMLVPPPCQGTAKQIFCHPGYEWTEKFTNKKIFYALFQGHQTQDLPMDYDFYVVSFHLEAVDLNWIKRQNVVGKIIVLFDGYDYELNLPNIYFVSFFYWHYQMELMLSWFGVQQKQKPYYKFSAVCNRITQSKVWIVTKLLETAKSESLIVLNNWLEEKSVHHWQPTGNVVLDDLTQKFQKTYLGQQIKIDEFDNGTQNRQSITANPWQPLYQDCAIHFTNESFHYSQMYENHQLYTWPGPFLTEKTLKCILGATAFIPVGQFQTFKILKDLGFKFDYDFDISWDDQAGNFDRACGVIDLIDWLNQFDVEQLVSLTQSSADYNQAHVLSKNFFKRCNEKNLEAIEKIYNIIYN